MLGLCSNSLALRLIQTIEDVRDIGMLSLIHSLLKNIFHGLRYVLA
jgi:hypothetical protein